MSILSKALLEKELHDQTASLKNILEVASYDLGCMVYFIILLTKISIASPLFIPAEVLIVAYAYVSASQYYRYFRIL